MPKERKLTLAQCIVGGYCGFGLFVGVLCYSIGAGVLFWLVMTTLLNVLYTGYYFMSTKPASTRDRVE